jgi:hypothetical protein
MYSTNISSHPMITKIMFNREDPMKMYCSRRLLFFFFFLASRLVTPCKDSSKDWIIESISLSHDLQCFVNANISQPNAPRSNDVVIHCILKPGS